MIIHDHIVSPFLLLQSKHEMHHIYNAPAVSLKMILHFRFFTGLLHLKKKKKGDVCFAAIASHEKWMTSQCFLLPIAPHICTEPGDCVWVSVLLPPSLSSSSSSSLLWLVLGVNNLTHISAWHTSALGLPWVRSSQAHTCCIIKQWGLEFCACNLCVTENFLWSC